MKKKISLFIAVVFAVACLFTFAACDDGGNDVIGVVAATAQNPDDKKSEINIGSFVYGEDDKINERLGGIKFYKEFGNGGYQEVAESELTVSYERNGPAFASKPAKYEVSDYLFTYKYKDSSNTVRISFTVERAKSEGFSVTLSKNSWKFGEDTASVTVKNPSGTVMKNSQSYFDTGEFSDSDDSEYGGLQLFAMKKSDYTQGGANVKSYTALTTLEDDIDSPNCGNNKIFGTKLINYDENSNLYALNAIYKSGDYVLIACIQATRNYKEIVCSAEFKITQPESPFGKTFVLADISVRGDSGNPAPEEVVSMMESIKQEQVGTTAICAANGNITGTCALGEIPFDDLDGADAFTLYFGEGLYYGISSPISVVVTNGYTDGDSKKFVLTGVFVKGAMVLSVQLSDEDGVAYWLDFAFTVQSDAK